MSKVALVTGGSGGIGRAICLQLAKDGFDVCVHYNSNRDSAEDVCGAVEETGQRAVALCGDLGDSAVCAAIMQGCVDALGGLDALVNNAGLTCDGLLMRMTDEQYHKVLRANLDSAFFMTREAVNHMAREKRGKQGGFGRADQVGGERIRPLGHLRQRGGAGVYRDRDDGRDDGLGKRRVEEEHPHAPDRQSGGCRPHGLVPVFGRRGLCDRTGFRGRRRNGDVA